MTRSGQSRASSVSGSNLSSAAPLYAHGTVPGPLQALVREQNVGSTQIRYGLGGAQRERGFRVEGFRV